MCCLSKHISTDDQVVVEDEVWSSVDDVIQLCQRSSDKLLESQREVGFLSEMWKASFELSVCKNQTSPKYVN